MKAWCVGLIAVGLAAVAVAAPVPPPPKEPDYGPVTDDQRGQSLEKLKAIGISLCNYHDVYNRLPNEVRTKKGKLLLSWRVQILPYLDQDELYKQFKLDEPWDSDDNKKLIAKMPDIFAPVRVKAKPGETFYRGFSGKTAWLRPGKPINLLMNDGSSNTVAVIEAGEPTVWTKPDELPFDPQKPLPKLGGLFDGEFHLVTFDGAVRRFPKTADRDVLKKAITPDGGEVFDWEDLTKDKD